MKTRIFASIIITGVLVSSAAQAGSTFSLDEIYSGFSPALATDVSSYYSVPPQLQAAAHKPTCNWRVAKNDLNPLKVVYPEENDIESNYLASPNLQLVC